VSIHLEHETSIQAPVELVFDLALDVDVHAASLASNKQCAIAGVTTGRVDVGEQVTWRATHFGIPFTMTTEITQLVRPHRFVEEQVDGAFRRFRHAYTFTTTGTSTVLTVQLDVEAPFGVLGRAAEQILLQRHFRQLIQRRATYLKTEAERRT
jgi:ligand-binding SRPBCC domain-containing protein